MSTRLEIAFAELQQAAKEAGIDLTIRVIIEGGVHQDTEGPDFLLSLVETVDLDVEGED